MMSRKEFIKATGIAASGILLSAGDVAFSSDSSKIKAIVFDGFPIFDPRPIFQKVRELFPVKAQQLNEIWSSKQFSYQWLRTAANKYKNFWDLTEDALVFAATACDIHLQETDVTSIMNEYNTINVWPDVIPALQRLRGMGMKTCILSNMTAGILNKGIHNSNTAELFDHVLSTDQKQTYKPSPAAYQMGVDTLGLKKEEILFVAFAGWDVAGARWFGYPTFWTNRLNAPPDQLDTVPEGSGKDLNDLIEFVKLFNR